MKDSMYFYDAAPGRILIVENGSALIKLCFADTKKAGSPDAKLKDTPLLKEAAAQLDEYFAGRRRRFELPLLLEGTPFQLKVWEALQDIPYGQTRSYGQIAHAIGNMRASRAVGMANSKTPLHHHPRHRVIGADGRLVGYGGGLERKSYLLNLEKLNS